MRKILNERNNIFDVRNNCVRACAGGQTYLCLDMCTCACLCVHVSVCVRTFGCIKVDACKCVKKHITKCWRLAGQTLHTELVPKANPPLTSCSQRGESSAPYSPRRPMAPPQEPSSTESSPQLPALRCTTSPTLGRAGELVPPESPSGRAK